MKKLYAFIYCPCIYESDYSTVSIHYSKEGAEKAMNEHKEKALNEFNEWYIFDEIRTFEFGFGEDWDITEITVLP
jgi:hypothetical protein